MRFYLYWFLVCIILYQAHNTLTGGKLVRNVGTLCFLPDAGNTGSTLVQKDPMCCKATKPVCPNWRKACRQITKTQHSQKYIKIIKENKNYSETKHFFKKRLKALKWRRRGREEGREGGGRAGSPETRLGMQAVYVGGDTRCPRRSQGV